jgi:hypothetical protein
MRGCHHDEDFHGCKFHIGAFRFERSDMKSTRYKMMTRFLLGKFKREGCLCLKSAFPDLRAAEFVLCRTRSKLSAILRGNSKAAAAGTNLPLRQVIVHNEAQHGDEHQNYGDPQTPIAMNVPPIRRPMKANSFVI